MDKIKLAETTTDPAILDEFSRDEDYYVRRGVTHNPNTSPETLKQMAIVEDDVDQVRYFIKNNPNCSLETYKYLSALEIIKTL